MVNKANENQHWISRVLLGRFKLPGNPFQCYQVETGEWIPKSLDRVCAWPGYNQLLVSGEPDNTLEEAFSKVESGLRNTLRALDRAATQPLSDLPPQIYENMCWYCAFLKGIAPISKPGAVVSFLIQINMELEKGGDSLLRELNIPVEIVNSWRKECVAGRKIVVESENILQLLFRFQFKRNYACNYSQFISTKWAVSKSPIELPMSDVGLVPMHLIDHKANHYMLPISPNLLLEGVFFHDGTKNSSKPIIRGLSYTQEEAEKTFDCICASAITEIICSRKIANIAGSISRAKASGVNFCKIVKPGTIAPAGLADVSIGDFRYRVVSGDEYVKFVHSFIRPQK